MAHSVSPRSPSRSPRRNGDLRLESEGEPAPPSSQVSVHTSATNSSPVLGATRSLPSEPPRAPRRMRNYMPHDDRPVTPPPVQTPTPDYIELASQAPSQLCGEPSSSRKLLILDLNGTLLHRAAPHGPRKDKRTSQGRPLPRLRPVHARPYMPSFRNFLFAPQTKKWLDAMIWSSAQPYSVEDMVDKTFGKSKSGLVAIWARDTLGLTDEQYNRKVQTFKDLAKPWAELPSLSTVGRRKQPRTPSSSSSTPRGSPQPSSPPTSLPSSSPRSISRTETPQGHSAMTTLLLDDSPRKAELQPYNHICLPEYSGELRAKDLVVLQMENERGRNEPEESFQDPQEESPVVSATGDVLSIQEGSNSSLEGANKKRKRKNKKRRKQHLGDGHDIQSYDETLIAVIGVLDEVKVQTNVAAWIRAGGLWVSPTSTPELDQPNEGQRDTSPSLVPDTVLPEDGDTTDGSDLSVDGTRTVGKRLRKRNSPNGGVEDKLPAGNDVISSAASPIADKTSVHGGKGESTGSPPSIMWFEDPSTFQYWISRGKRALEELGISLEHGIDR